VFCVSDDDWIIICLLSWLLKLEAVRWDSDPAFFITKAFKGSCNEKILKVKVFWLAMQGRCYSGSCLLLVHSVIVQKTMQLMIIMTI